MEQEKEFLADKEELLCVLDEEGNKTGKYELRSLVHKNGLFHNEVALWIIDKENKSVLIQKRSPNKIHNPNKIGLCAGHVVADDTLEETVFKEAREEIGVDLSDYKLNFLIRLKRYDQNQKCFSYHYYIFAKIDVSKVKIQKEELTDVFYIDYQKLKEKVKNNDEDISLSWKTVYNPVFEKLDKIILDI